MLKLLKYEKQRDTWCGETLAARYRVAIKNAQWRPGGKRQVSWEVTIRLFRLLSRLSSAFLSVSLNRVTSLEQMCVVKTVNSKHD